MSVIKVGDRVKSEYWGDEGIVQDIRPCGGIVQCHHESLTLDAEDFKVRAYHHSETFVVIPAEETT